MQRSQPYLQQMDQTIIEKWENELSIHGSVRNEGELLQYLKKHDLDSENNQMLAAQILTIAARSSAAKGKREAYVLALMEKAEQLDHNNVIAKNYLTCYEWKKSSKLLDELTFSPLRETDNRQAKKQNVERYIHTCKNFLQEAAEHLERLAGLTESPLYDISNKDSSAFYEKIIGILENIKSEVESLLQASSEYKDTLVGTFHTAVYLEDIKKHLSQIDALKSKWSIVFNGLEKTEENIKLTALEELHQMIGLQSVKSRVNDFYQFFKYQKGRKEQGFQTKDEVSLNMIITGNPGTGKTTLARLFAKIYHELGVLPREEVIETDRAQLVGSYVGQTEENVRAVVEKALGGVLFIDEAYNLKREGQSGNDYGQTVVDTLVSLGVK